MSVPDYQSLMLPLLKRAVEVARPATMLELQPLIADDLGLSETQLAERLRSGKQAVFHNRLHWAKQYMTRAGLLESTRHGQFQPTAAGRTLFGEGLPTINNKVLARYPAFVSWLSSRDIGDATAESGATTSPRGPEPHGLTPEERIEVARRELEASLKADLLDRARSMPPSEFEQLVINLLVKMGYGQGEDEMAEALGGSGDGGVDGVINQDRLGLDRVYIQAKRYKDGNTVGPDAINSFIGALNIKRANKGLFVTASSFTKQALEHARHSSTHVVLVDGERLAELMVRHGVGVVVRNTIEVKAVDEGYFGD